MRNKEGGQAFILILLILAIGPILVVPLLRLSYTGLKSSETITSRTRALYAVDGAQEYIMWKLLHKNWAQDFTAENPEGILTIENCGTTVTATIVMRAIPGAGGMTLATDDVMRPTKTVSPSVSDGSYQPYTYIIRLEQLSGNTTQGLDAVYDILPREFGTGSYVPGSSEIRVDGGPWEPLGDPLAESSGSSSYGGQERLRWPASGNFASPIRDFEVRQVKELKFQVAESLKNDTIYYNWVVLKPWNTISGATANITVGDGSNPEGGLLAVNKVADPEIVQPGVETDIEYTIRITNLDGSTHQIQSVTDYLPPGFIYIGPTSGITTFDPQLSLENINGVDRWQLLWTVDEFPNGNAVSIASGETAYLTFWAQTTKDVSGSYYNEVTAVPNTPLPTIFEDLGITYEDFNTSYSWNTGAVLVPSFDSRTEGDGIVLDSNLSMIVGGISINSFTFR